MNKSLVCALLFMTALGLSAQSVPAPTPTSTPAPETAAPVVVPVPVIPADTAQTGVDSAAASGGIPMAEPGVTFAVINLYGKALDFQFGETGLKSLNALQPNQPSKFFTVALKPETWLFFRESDSPDWKVYADRAGNALSLDFAPGSRQMLLINPKGELSFTAIETPEQAEGGAVISLLNATGRPLDALQISRMHKNSQLFQSPPIESSRMTRFASLEQGLYTLGAVLEGNRVVMKNPENTAMSVVELVPASWTLAMALPSDDQANPVNFRIWNLGDN